MRTPFAVLLLAGAIGWSGRPLLAQSAPGQPLNLTELGSSVFLPLQSSTQWTTKGNFERYPSGGDIATLAVPLDSSRFPDGAHIRKICFYYFDDNPDVDMTSLVLEARQPAGGGAPIQAVPAGWTVSSGTPGYGAACFDLDLPLNYSPAASGGGVDLADYNLLVGFGTFLDPSLAEDGSITLQRVALYWTKPTGKP